MLTVFTFVYCVSMLTLANQHMTEGTTEAYGNIIIFLLLYCRTKDKALTE